MKTPKTKSWISTVGQLTYTFTDDSYTPGQLTVYVGVITQLRGVNFSEDSPTGFTLLCDVSEISPRMEIKAIYK